MFKLPSTPQKSGHIESLLSENLLLHQIDFLKHVFGNDIKDNIGIFLQNSTIIEDSTIQKIKNRISSTAQVIGI